MTNKLELFTNWIIWEAIKDENEELENALDFVIQYTNKKMTGSIVGQTDERDAIHKFMDVAVGDNDWPVILEQ